MKKLTNICLFILIFSFPILSIAIEKNIAYQFNISGGIGPATHDFVVRGIELASSKNAKLVILKIDTPGGLDKSMRGIIKAILSSPIPIISFVAPSGARAASAGTYILYASHIAAMAPGTNLGAATPISIGGVGAPTPENDNQKKEGKEKQKAPNNAITAKATNDAVAYIKGLAQLRDRNDTWAEAAVREAASIPAKEAFKKNVINLIAKDTADLLAQLNGRRVNVLGKSITLNTDNITTKIIQPDWRNRILAVITDPSISYILLLIGIYGLFFEFANPGFIIPGVTGAIALLLALYAFQLLPINYAGLGLIVLGMVFLAAEAFMPSFGALGIGGIIAFIAGSLLLFDTNTKGFYLSWYLIIGMALINLGFFLGALGMALRSQSRPKVSGEEELIGMEGIATEDFDTDGWIKVHSERWKAHSTSPVKKNQKVTIRSIDGLTLKVKPKTSDH